MRIGMCVGKRNCVHQSYAEKSEEQRGAYPREYTALLEYKTYMASQGMESRPGKSRPGKSRPGKSRLEKS